MQPSSHQRLLLVALFLVFYFTGLAHSALLYVDGQNGVDTNSGSQGSPFRTIQKCASTAVAGDTCLIRGGTYRETVRPANSGISDRPITFKPASDNETVIINGADIVTGPWSRHSGSIFKTSSMNWDIYAFNSTTNVANQIFVDGVMMPEARWPNILPSQVTAVSFAMMAQMENATVTTNTTATFKCAALRDTFWAGGISVFASGYAWGTTSCDVGASRVGELDITCLGRPGIRPQSWTVGGSGTDPSTPQAGNYFWLFGKLEGLDSPGEWFFDRTTKTLYLWVEDSSNPSSSNKLIEAKARIHAFDLRSRSYITVEGVHTFAASINAGSATNIIVKEVELLYAAHSMEIGQLYRSSLSAAAVAMQTTNDSQVIDSVIKYASGNSVGVSGYRNLIKNNVISHVSYGPYGDGIAVRVPTQGAGVTDIGTDHNEFRQNTLHTSSGVMVAIGTGQHIRYNDVFNTGLQRADLGVIYGQGITCNGYTADIDHNWAHDCHSPLNLTLNYFGCSGIYLDGMCSNLRVYRNVAWNTQTTPFSTVPGVAPDPLTANDFWYYNTGLGSKFFVNDNHPYLNNVVQNNIIPNSIDGPATGFTAINNFFSDPIFVDSDNYDFRLRPYSPAVDGGTRLGAPYDAQVPNSQTPDYGAYDTSLDNWIPGAVLRPSDLPFLEFSCSSTPEGALDCIIEGLPEGRKLPSTFSVSLGSLGSSSPSGNVTTCRTDFNYTTSQGVGRCEGIAAPPDYVPGTPLHIFINPFEPSNPTQWTTTGVTAAINSLSIYSIEPNFGLAGTLVTITGDAFPYRGSRSTSLRYSTQISVTGPGNKPLYLYPVQLRVNTAGLIAQGKLRDDCNDLSFFDSYGRVPHWLEGPCNTTATLFWVRFTYIAQTGTTTLRMLYGDPGLTMTTSSPEDTFVDFEDFDDAASVDTTKWQVGSGSFYTIDVVDGQLRLVGTSDTTNRYTWITMFSMQAALRNKIQQFGDFAIDSQVSVMSAPSGWAMSPAAGPTALIGALTNSKKPISRYSSGWSKIGASDVGGVSFIQSKTYTIGFFDGATTVRWFEDNEMSTIIANATTTAVSSFSLWFSPQEVATNFEARLDKVRVRPFNLPDPSASIQQGAESISEDYVEVYVGGQPCLNVVLLSSGQLQCSVGELGIPYGTWVDVQITTTRGTVTLPSSFLYGATYMSAASSLHSFLF